MAKAEHMIGRDRRSRQSRTKHAMTACKIARYAAAKDFVSDAFAHAKFIAHTETAMPLLNKAGITPDEGVIPLKIADDATRFLARCRQVRLWRQEAETHTV
jgi:catalase